MYKLIILLCLCVCVINCKLKCNIGKIIDLQTGEIHDKADFCMDKNCVLRICGKNNTPIKPDYMYVQVDNKRTCKRWDWVAEDTGITLNVSVYKSDFTKSEKRINDFTYIALYKKTLLELKSCIEKDMDRYPYGDYSFLEDGSLWISKYGKDAVLPSQEFIVEFRVRMFNGQWVGPEIVVSKMTKVDTTYYQAIGMIISCVFLILVLVVYCMFKQLRGHYGKILMAYIACFTASYALMATQLLSMKARLFYEIHCKIFSPILYFSILATFFWLNVMSYEIWNTFRPKNKFRSPKSREGSHSFLKTALYAFGVPLLMLVVALILNEKLTTYKPYFEKCMSPGQSHLFHYVPMTILLCVNMIFFVMTTYHLWQRKKGNILNNKESRITKRDQNKFGLYIKLSMSTGVYWILDVIVVYSSFPYYVDYIFEAYIILLGVILFVVLVCNKNVLKLMSKRFGFNNRFVNQSSLNTTSLQDSKKNRSMKKKESIESNP